MGTGRSALALIGLLVLVGMTGTVVAAGVATVARTAPDTGGFVLLFEQP
ncbi:MAG: hypothetical protein RL030_298 [Pseudomonadota bacterium]|jgi:hypothetical protein